MEFGTILTEHAISCEEIDTSFDQLEQKLPQLLFKDTNSRVTYIFHTYVVFKATTRTWTIFEQRVISLYLAKTHILAYFW